MSDKKTASLPTHTRHQSVSGPYPVLAAPSCRESPLGEAAGATRYDRTWLTHQTGRAAVEASGQQNAYRAGNPAPLVETAPAAPPLRVVDWGRSGPNQMITLNALRALKAVGRLTLHAIRT